MIGEIGQLALCLALALSLVMAGAGLIGARGVAANARALASGATMGFAVFVTLAFGALMVAFVTSDFSIMDVANNSHTMKPLIYKITGVWANHEGSMLLWVLVLALYSAAIAFARRGSERLTSAALGVQGLLAAAFLLFILFTSNPFLRLDPPPFEGAGLNPLLQDPGLAFHPPMLYAGYVGLSAAFAYAAAALITGEADSQWARAARPFMLMAWIALTLGITLGSWWAYYDLGWGGFWFWDPVENASLMPWLVATALLHSALATERTGAFRTWTLLLAIAGFSLSLIGTFLVRSGVLTSVHAFANDPERGKFILAMLGAAIGGALALFAWRAPKLEGGSAFFMASRETMLLLNNLLLFGAVSAVFLGTLFPLFQEAITGAKISVGAPYFAITFAPIFVVLLLLVPFGPRLGWKRGDLKEAARALAPVAGIALLFGVLVLAIATPHALAAGGSFALAAWLIVSSAADLRLRVKSRSLSPSAWASAFAHAGLGITLMGIAGTSLWRVEAQDVLAPGGTLPVAGYSLRLDNVVLVQGKNYRAEQALVSVLADGHTIAMLRPEKRFFPAEGQAISETSIRTTGFSDLYVALGDQRDDKWIIRAYVNPLAPFIWFGGGFMALGGLTSLTGRLRRRAVAGALAEMPAQ
ncbi:MAG: heme lyase CcmF/NrfE family subunit [Proteobacteria bacterium]|nr:heme lyase CcmF/NrfE family subunit [Pseudomonadota bacterium]